MMTGNRLELGTRTGPRDACTSEGLADTYEGDVDMSKPTKPCKHSDGCQALTSSSTGLCKKHYMKEWRAANAERPREYQQEYDRTRRDPEKHRARSRRYRNENIEEVRRKDRKRARANKAARAEYFKAWREQNAEYIAKKRHEYYQANKEARAAYFQKWYAKNSEIAKTSARRRSARKAGADGSHTESEWLMVLRAYDHRCAYCSGPAESRDHVIPLSKGGRDDIDNIVPACNPCNSSKRNRYLWNWTNRPSQTTRR